MKHVTHEWTGEPHASESIKRVDGVEVARNLVPNPSYEINVHTPDKSEPNNRWSASTRVRNLGALYGDYSWGLTVAEATSRFTYFGKNLNRLEPGSWVAFKVPVEVSPSVNNDTRYLSARSGTRSSGSFNYGDFYPIVAGEPGESVVLEGTFQIPNDHSDVSVIIYVYADEDQNVEPTPGWIFRQDGFHVATADTEADALAQVGTYFDGDTEDYFTMPLFKVRANGAWHPVAPKAFLGGAFRDG